MTRLDRVRNILARKKIDALLVAHPPNVSYLADFPTEDSSLVVLRNKTFLITDYRYSTEYRNLIEEPNVHIITIEKSFSNTLKKLKADLGIRTLGFENNTIRYLEFQKLKKIFGEKLIPTQNIIESLRMVKDDKEISRMKKAIAITLAAFRHIKKFLKVGAKETEIAAELERYIRLQGATEASFSIIVASGEHSSFPHAKRTERRLRTNEPVMIDMGVDYHGYKSDLTRVYFLGRMNPLFKKIHSIVSTAQHKAMRLIRPGVSIKALDNEARQFIQKQGYGDCFKHSLGHGIGLEVHEQPTIAGYNRLKLKQGMVVTIEPAIYLDNKFGVRLEEMVLVTQKGSEVLSA